MGRRLDGHLIAETLGFEIGDALRVTADGGALDRYLLPGPSMPEVMRRYTALTGRTPLPAPWALGFQPSRWEGPCDGSPIDKPYCSAAQLVDLATT